MQKIFTSLSLFIIMTLTLISPSIIFAISPNPSPPSADKLTGITNPVVGELGGNTAESKQLAEGGQLFLKQFVNLWRNAINVGAILLIVYYIWGGIEWITAGGDAGKLEKARNRLLQATIGLVILASSFIIIGFISYGLFGENFDILNFEFMTAK